MSGRSYDERHGAGSAVMRRMGEGPAGDLGNSDPQRAARAMRRKLGALGSFNTDNVLGDVWACGDVCQYATSNAQDRDCGTESRPQSLD